MATLEHPQEDNSEPLTHETFDEVTAKAEALKLRLAEAFEPDSAYRTALRQALETARESHDAEIAKRAEAELKKRRQRSDAQSDIMNDINERRYRGDKS